MANKKISELTDLESIKGTERTVVAIDGNNRSVELNKVKNWAREGLATTELATTDLNGLMSSEDKAKLNSALVKNADSVIEATMHYELPYVKVVKPLSIMSLGFTMPHDKINSIATKVMFTEVAENGFLLGGDDVQYIDIYNNKFAIGSTSRDKTSSIVINKEYDLFFDMNGETNIRTLHVTADGVNESTYRDVTSLLPTITARIRPIYMFGIDPTVVTPWVNFFQYPAIFTVDGTVISHITPVYKYDIEQICWFDKIRKQYYIDENLGCFEYDGIIPEKPSHVSEEIVITTKSFAIPKLEIDVARKNIGLSSAAHMNVGAPSLYLSEPYVHDTSLHTQPLSDLYAVYDDMIIKYPQWIERLDDIGVDQDGNGIRQYEIRFQYPAYSTNTGYAPTPNVYDRATMDYKKVIINAALHGDEKTGAYGLALALDEMLGSSENWATYIKGNLILRIIPCVNVWGYENNSRENKSGVDLNRDSRAKEQLESQALANWMIGNTDAEFYIDVHSCARWRQWLSVWVKSPYKLEWIRLATKLTASFHDNWSPIYAATPSVAKPYMYASGHDIPETFLAFGDDLGMKAILTETARSAQGNDNVNSMEACKFTKDMILNLLQNMV